MATDWEMEAGAAAPNPDDQQQPLSLKQPRSPRKLTKDSGYQTSDQCDPDYANSISDWFSQEKSLDQIDDGVSWNKDSHVRNPKTGVNGEKR